MDSGWTIRQTQLQSRHVGKWETIFALANGQLGLRGTLDDARTIYHTGTYLNGFHDTEPIVYGEHAYGYATHRQRMLNVTDGTSILLWVDDDAFDLSTGTLESFRRELDLRTGIVHAQYRWRSPSGILVHLSTRRVVPFTRRAVAAMEWHLELPEQDAMVTVVSSIALRSRPDKAGDDPRVGAKLSRNALTKPYVELNHEYALLGHTTRSTRFRVACAMGHTLDTQARSHRVVERHVNELAHRYIIWAERGVPVRLEKHLAYEFSRDRKRVQIGGHLKRSLARARDVGFAGLAAEQEDYLSRFWSVADVRIEGALEVQESIRFNLFHVLQAAGHDGFTNLGAKGLTGEGYEGHYFWDTEIYALPIFTYLRPEVARRLIEFRYHTLPQARERARELNHAGALYPWRTINGHEASAYFPAGTAQYHINADIIYAARRYVRATGDTEALHRFVAEMAFEVARFWYSLGDFIEGRGFCINMVTGPDEYTALVNNNVYTNLMAQDVLRYAADLADTLPHDAPHEWERLGDALHLAPDEPREWRRAADAVFIPYDEKRGLYPQDDSFFQKAVWDFEGTPAENYPLLLHYHPLNIYRYQVLKQPDLVMALFVQGDRFDMEAKRRNFHYYDALTTGDSSLAACVQSIMAAEIGEPEAAYRYFVKTVRMDLDDINRNVKDGIHAAAMAGTWLSVVFGFAGLRDFGGRISFRPHLPTEWRSLAFHLRIMGAVLDVTMDAQLTRYLWHGTEELTIAHNDAAIPLPPGTPVEVATPDGA